LRRGRRKKAAYRRRRKKSHLLGKGESRPCALRHPYRLDGVLRLEKENRQPHNYEAERTSPISSLQEGNSFPICKTYFVQASAKKTASCFSEGGREKGRFLHNFGPLRGADSGKKGRKAHYNCEKKKKKERPSRRVWPTQYARRRREEGEEELLFPRFLATKGGKEKRESFGGSRSRQPHVRGKRRGRADSRLGVEKKRKKGESSSILARPCRRASPAREKVCTKKEPYAPPGSGMRACDRGGRALFFRSCRRKTALSAII